jgi:adenosylcobyric acid synthase
MIQGTMSNAGKSIIATGLCRIFAQDGYRVAPFKSQNMALNSFITADGGEMGRAQVVQAEACGLEPIVAMNPTLLKPVSDAGSQVIVNGRARATMTASEYFVIRNSLVPEIMAGYESLARGNDIIVIEGAGSPAEINLRNGDIVNMGLAKLVDAPVLLVGDIDRGGVFAQLVGTCVLLPDDEKERIHGFILNKFRGDVTLLADGLGQLRQLTGKPTLGVVPYLSLDIDDEDSLSERLHTRAADPGYGSRDIAVIRLPRVSNFTDFTALGATPGLAVRYVDAPQQLGDPDLLIIPGTRNTIADLRWLRETGLDQAIISRAGSGRLIFGICGGYQMLCQSIADPEGVEGGETVPGLGLLPVVTRFQPSKHQTRVSGTVLNVAGPLAVLSGALVKGYVIHLGESMLLAGAAPFIRLEDGTLDGCWQGSVCGSYLHGLFDSTSVRQAVLSMLGLPAIAGLADYAEHRERQYDLLADALRASLDIDRIYQLMGVNR